MDKQRGRISEAQLEAVMPKCASKRAAIWSVKEPLDGAVKKFMETLARCVATLNNHEKMVATQTSPLPPITGLPYVSAMTMRAAYNFVTAYYYAAHASTSTNTKTSFASIASILSISLCNAAEALYEELGRVVPSLAVDQAALLVAVCIAYHIYPNALLTGKSRTVAAIVELFSDLAAIMVLAGDNDSAKSISQWLPSLDRTGVVVCEALLGQRHALSLLSVDGVLTEQQDGKTTSSSPTFVALKRLALFELALHRAAITSPVTPTLYGSNSFDAGREMPLDPLETTLNTSRFLASKTRAPLTWPPIATIKASASAWYGGSGHCIDVPNDRAPILVKENLRHAPVGSGGGGGQSRDGSRPNQLRGHEFTIMAHKTAREILKTPANLITKPENRKALPLCACSALKQAERTGHMHNEDRWWVTNFTLDVMGSEEDVTDIEDLVLGFQLVCRDFPQKSAAHVRAQAQRHKATAEKNVREEKPELVLSNCKAMKQKFFEKSDRRGSACPFAEINSDTMGRAEVRKLLEWQLGEDPLTALGQADLNAILDGVDAHDSDTGCLAHYNAMLRKRLGPNAHERSKKITFPSQFTQFQCLHSKPH